MPEIMPKCVMPDHIMDLVVSQTRLPDTRKKPVILGVDQSEFVTDLTDALDKKCHGFHAGCDEGCKNCMPTYLTITLKNVRGFYEALPIFVPPFDWNCEPEKLPRSYTAKLQSYSMATEKAVYLVEEIDA